MIKGYGSGLIEYLISYVPLTRTSQKKPLALKNLNDYLINEVEATFFVRIRGDSMIEAGIFDNDVAIVDKSRLAKVGDIVLAEVDGEYTIKSLAKSKQGLPRLLPANSKFSPIEIKEGQQFHIVGVVTGSVRKFK